MIGLAFGSGVTTDSAATAGSAGGVLELWQILSPFLLPPGSITFLSANVSVS
jgi:hypothetical protein